MFHSAQVAAGLPHARRHILRSHSGSGARKRLLCGLAAVIASVLLLPESALAFKFPFIGRLAHRHPGLLNSARERRRKPLRDRTVP